MEEKFIPKKLNMRYDAKNKRWYQVLFQGGSEVNVHQQHISSSAPQGYSRMDEPSTSRYRSSSIAVARRTPDLHRFLQAETGPWGHLSPSPRSPIRRPTLDPDTTSSSLRRSRDPNLGGPSSAGPSGLARSGPHGSGVRPRTSSMPAVPRHRPMLADTKRTACVPEDDGLEYYRLRSFSITPNGVFNLGDTFKTRYKSVDSDSFDSRNSTREGRLLRVGMLGASDVGKTCLSVQFGTSDYIFPYDMSMDEDYGDKYASVLIDGQETELEIIDRPASEMSMEAFCLAYNPDVFAVVYSVVDRRSLRIAEQMLLYLWRNDYMATHGIILVGNKVDLERKRKIPTSIGRRTANNCGCKFIETSSCLAHHVDELLIGILAQVKLNPHRSREQLIRRYNNRHNILRQLFSFKWDTKSCENLFDL